MLKIQLFQFKLQCLEQPQSTQDEISSKIDNQVRSLAYVNSVKTESIPNASIVTVEYDNGTDMDKAEEQLKRNR